MRLRCVGPQPLLHAHRGKVIEHCADGIVVVAGHTDQSLQVISRQAVALDDVTVTQFPRPRSPVHHERVNALPLVADCLHWYELVTLPLQRLALALDWALEHGVRESDDVVQEFVERFVPTAFGQLVFHLAFHAGDALIRLFFELALRLVFHLHSHDAELFRRRWLPTLLQMRHQLLSQRSL